MILICISIIIYASVRAHDDLTHEVEDHTHDVYAFTPSEWDRFLIMPRLQENKDITL